jgi:hypothetical protein
MSTHSVKNWQSKRSSDCEDYVALVIDNKTWIFNCKSFDRDSLETLMGVRATCRGCVVLPKNGNRSKKLNWCELSSQVANLQEGELSSYSANILPEDSFSESSEESEEDESSSSSEESPSDKEESTADNCKSGMCPVVEVPSSV